MSYEAGVLLGGNGSPDGVCGCAPRKRLTETYEVHNCYNRHELFQAGVDIAKLELDPDRLSSISSAKTAQKPSTRT